MDEADAKHSDSRVLIKKAHSLLERPILTFETRFTKGMDPQTGPEDAGWGTVMSARQFLVKKWPQDGCCVVYLHRADGAAQRAPMINVSLLDEIGRFVMVEWFAIDVDRANHAAASEEWLLEQLEKVRAFKPGAFYGTRSGYRVLWPLKTPLTVLEFKQFFAWMVGGMRPGTTRVKRPIGTMRGQAVPGVLRRYGIEADTHCQTFNWRYFAPACRKGDKDVTPKVCDFSEVVEIDPDEDREEWELVDVDTVHERDRTPINLEAAIIPDQEALAQYLWKQVKIELVERADELRTLQKGRNIFLRNAVADLMRTVAVVESLYPGIKDGALRMIEVALLQAVEKGARSQGLERDESKDSAAIRSGVRHAELDPWGASWLDTQMFTFEIVSRAEARRKAIR